MGAGRNWNDILFEQKLPNLEKLKIMLTFSDIIWSFKYLLKSVTTRSLLVVQDCINNNNNNKHSNIDNSYYINS